MLLPLVAKNLATMEPPLMVIDGANLFRLNVDPDACCPVVRRRFERYYLMHGARALFWEGNLQCTLVIGTVELKYRCKEPGQVEELYRVVSFDYSRSRTRARFRLEADDDGRVYPACLWLVHNHTRYPFVGPL